MPRIPTHPELPSVTEVLANVGLAGDYRHVDPELRARAMARGKGLHRAIELHHADRLDLGSLHPELQPAFEGYLAFLDAHVHKPLASELALIHPHGYVGHLDRIGAVDGALALVDFKLTDGPDLVAARLQLAGYRLLWDAQGEGRREDPVERCYVLQLSKGGGFRLHDLTDAYAMQEFLAALIVWRAKHRRRP